MLIDFQSKTVVWMLGPRQQPKAACYLHHQLFTSHVICITCYLYHMLFTSHVIYITLLTITCYLHHILFPSHVIYITCYLHHILFPSHVICITMCHSWLQSNSICSAAMHTQMKMAKVSSMFLHHYLKDGCRLLFRISQAKPENYERGADLCDEVSNEPAASDLRLIDTHVKLRVINCFSQGTDSYKFHQNACIDTDCHRFTIYHSIPIPLQPCHSVTSNLGTLPLVFIFCLKNITTTVPHSSEDYQSQ